MNRLYKIYSLILVSVFCLNAHAKLNVMTTTTNLKSVVESIGGDKVHVESFCKGTQDPHYIEAKPSYTLKAAKADLLVSIGLDLEIGWLPLIIRGARNPKLRAGNVGSFVTGEYIDTLEKPKAGISRAEGDVHPEGNPHFMLDPQNALVVAEKLKEKLKIMDPENSDQYESNFKKFEDQLKAKLVNWEKRVKAGKKVITYHKTLTYFYHRFGIKNVSLLEPKPGVPPSASHILDVMKNAKDEGVKLVLVENYFDPTVANRVARDVDGLKVDIVPVSVGGEPNITNLFDLYERLVSSVEER
ncbi:MAG: ABC transporter substrate-binding protein [Bdellovibrio sp. CG11_big_fil_rev_8_21_14_0_20_39_38]|nr:MAG: ABC transporter substrate-binding protein [Bdellovibrio sp. CG11_big_fil_rev_8_21_14_0_20_39_38]